MPVSTIDPDVLQLRAIDQALARMKLEQYKPYPKQAEFHRVGGDEDVRERLLMAGNQVGKTLSAAAETAMHLTGKYPDWWEGVRYDRPVTWMAASETGKLTRDGVQVHLCGWPKYPKGQGMIPALDLLETPAAQGLPDAYDYIRVQHYDKDGVKDGESLCYLRSYDQGRARVQSLTLDGVWLDEEPDLDYYSECLTRTNVVLGPVYLTFTPLKGMSDVVKRFMLDQQEGTAIISMTIEDALHYSAEHRRKVIAGYPEHEKEARSMGIPILGSGRIFPVPEEWLKESQIVIPVHWPRIAGIDFGYDHPTAVAWMAWDRDADVVHVYDCHRVKKQTPVFHASAIKARPTWIPMAWPHDAYQHDKGGSCDQLCAQYRKEGVNMLPAHATHAPDPEQNQKEGEGGYGREAGLTMMLDRMNTGRLKVAAHLNDWWEEFRLYHRQDGKVVDENDDLMSATRYGLMMLRHSKIQPAPKTTRKAAAFQPSNPMMGTLG